MPHITVKMWPGRDRETKELLAKRLEEALREVTGVSSEAVSVVITDVPQDRWTETVVEPEILGHKEDLFKAPGYPVE